MSPIWDSMKADGSPMTAQEYLTRAYGQVPKSLGPEELQEVPAEIRDEAQTLTSRSPAEPDPQNQPTDPALDAIEAGLEATGRRRPN